MFSGLELMKNDQENNQVSDSPPPAKKSKKSKKNKKNKTVFETQEEARNQADAIEEGGGRKYTVSLALAGSILDNAQSAELRTYLAGRSREHWPSSPSTRSSSLTTRDVSSWKKARKRSSTTPRSREQAAAAFSWHGFYSS